MTYRRLKVLLNGLPPESMTKTAVRDSLSGADWESMPAPTGWGSWSRTDELLAVVVDRLSWLTYATYAAQGGKPTEPDPMDRPGIGKPPWERQEELRRVVSYVDYLRTHGGAVPPPGWTPDD